MPGSGTSASSSSTTCAIPRAQEILGVERKVHTAEHLASAMLLPGRAASVEIPRAKLFAPATRRPIAESRPPSFTPSPRQPEKTWPRRELSGGRRPSAQTRHRPRLHRRARRRPLALRALSAPFRRAARRNQGSARRSLPVRRQRFRPGPHGGRVRRALVVVIFGPSDPAIWGPWRTAGEVVSAPGGIGDVTVDAGARRAAAPAGARMNAAPAPALLRPQVLAADSALRWS